MKKGLLLFLFIGLFIQTKAQDVIWSDDFSNGFTGWTVKSNSCGSYSGGLIGEWTLSRAVIDGNEVSGVNGILSIGTDESYQANFSNGTDELLVQGSYSLNNGTFESNLTGETLNLMDQTVKTENNDTITIYYANLNTTQGDFDNLQAAVGIGDPSYALSGQTLTITLGNDSFTYQKSANCGALWEWDQIGWVGDGALIFPEAAVISETATNGAAVLNADYLTSKGNVNNIPGQPYPTYFSELISPTIDLSGVETGVLVSFSQFVRKLNEDDNAPINPLTGDRLLTSLAYSIDNGNSWSAPIDVTEEVSVNDLYAGVDSFPLPNVIIGNPEVKIKFIWAGDFYFWAIDDVAISSRPAFDMKVNENFLAYAPNRATPMSQVENVSFLADIQNDGASTAENVQLNLTITNEVSGADVYNSTINYGSIASDSLAENNIFPDQLQAAAIASEVAAYRGTYNVSFNGGDDLVPTNNTSTFDFFVLDSLFAKENADGLRTIAPQDDNSYTWGNIFYVPNGSGYYARTIAFAIANPDELIGKPVTVLLYEWDGDTNGDFEANPEEYGDSPIAFNSYEITGSEVGQIIRLPIDVSGQGIPLQDGKHYMAMVQYFTEDDQPMFLLGSDEFDYSATWFVSDSLEMTRYNAALEVGQPDAPSFSTLGFGRNIVPLVRLSIGDNPDLSMPAISMSTSAEEELPTENTVAVYPNPVEDVLQLEIGLTEVSEKIHVNIFDQTGRALFYRMYDQLQQAKFDYNLSQYPTGVYYIKIDTELGSRTQKFIKK
jgi:hypothetical protein